MKKTKTKLIGIMAIILLVVALILPMQVLATEEVANKDLQIVKDSEGDYIIYVKGVTEEFKYHVDVNDNLTDAELEGICQNSTTDEGETPNHVAVILEQNATADQYIYIKTNEGTSVTPLNFEEAFEKSAMEEVETSTKRIPTEIVTDIIEKDEEVDGVKVKVTVGGMKITDNEEAEYTYFYKKLPTEKYSTLMELAEKINAEYNEMDMYSKIEIAKEFNKLYNELKEAEEYMPVENMTIMQPNDAQKGEQYIIFLKKVDDEGNETIDIKLMTSYREDEEEKIPGRTETVAVNETARLPITGDSIVLFVILAVIILIAIIVFIKMKKLQGNQSKH